MIHKIRNDLQFFNPKLMKLCNVIFILYFLFSFNTNLKLIHVIINLLFKSFFTFSISLPEVLIKADNLNQIFKFQN